MADASVSLLPRVGVKTKEVLAKANIRTVGELANADISNLQISGIASLQVTARKYIEEHGEQSAKVFETPEKKELEHRLIEQHSWYELTVKLPHPRNPRNLVEAVIYELSIVPGSLGFLCSWTENNETELFESPFTPQFLFHFNRSILPELVIYMKPADFDSLPEAYVFKHLLEEVRIMLACEVPH